MGVTSIVETSVNKFADGRSFGSTGAYELVKARFHIDLDPEHSSNERLVDIGRAERSAGGSVQVVSDGLILRPADPRRGNKGLLAVVPNRGMTGGIPFDVGAPSLLGAGRELVAGDGWLLESGWTIAWTGWQWELPNDLLACRVPDVIDDAGTQMLGDVRIKLHPIMPCHTMRLNSSGDLRGAANRFYSAADLDQIDATLRIGPGRGWSTRTVERSAWRFAREVNGHLEADADHIWLRDGFQPDHGYEIVYRTCVCPFAAGGLAAFRDGMAHLRYDVPGRELGFAIAVGWSQSGRFLRQFLLDGLNLDETNRQVFDAVLPFIAGASRGEFNQRYAQPAEALAPGLGHLPPFDLKGLLARQREKGGIPKVIVVNSGSEYWRADGSLGHIDLDTQLDLLPQPGTRTYYLAGTEHVGGALMQPHPPGPRNFLSPWPINRAILDIARSWVVDGVEPPPSHTPQFSDHTAVSRTHVLEKFEALGITRVPPEERLATRWEIDLGDQIEAGIARYPARAMRHYPAFVADVDSDGNEIAGILLPELQAPLATHAPWNTALAESARWEGLSVLCGNSYPFPRTAAERESLGDPRPSIEERYPTRSAYLAHVRSAIERLIAARFVLQRDVAAIERFAERRYDQLMAS